jgi:hypothetical protein
MNISGGLDADFNLLCTVEKTTALPYNASKLMQIDWVGGSPCWFDLKPDSNGGKGRNSPQFAVNPSARPTPMTVGLEQSTSSSTTTATSTSTTGTSMTGTSTTGTSTGTTTSQSNAEVSATGTVTPSSSANSKPESASSTSTPATASKASGGLSTGVKAAIGIVVALGCVLGLALAAFFYWRKRRSQNTENHMPVPHSDQDLKAPEVYTPDYKSPPVYTHTTHEMYAPVSELPASGHIHHELPGRG